MKQSHSLLFFVLIAVALLGAVLAVLRKLAPTSLTSLASHCQIITQSLGFHLPHLLWPLTIALSAFIIITTAAKAISGMAKGWRLTRDLSKNLILQNRFIKVTTKLDLPTRAFLVESERLFAFCLGIFNPKIYVSTKLVNTLSYSELEVVLRHEKYHLDHHDGLVLLLARLTQSLFPILPILADFGRNYCIEREIRADWEATADASSRRELISVLRKLLILEPTDLAFSPAIADHDSLEPRIKALVARNYGFKKYQLANVIISLLSVSILAGIIFAPVQAVELHNRDQDVMLVCVSKPYTQSVSVSTPATPVTATR